MIVTNFIHILFGIIEVVMNWFPTFPAIPSSISAMETWLTNAIANTASVLVDIYGATLFNAIISVLAAFWAFQLIWRPARWIIKMMKVTG